MAATPEPEAPLVARPRSRFSALRPTARFRAQLARTGIVLLVVVGIFGTLTLAFGISVLQYALGGMVISSIVIVAAIGLTVLYGIRGFANFAYGDIATLGGYVALVLTFGGISLVLGAIITFLLLAAFGVFLELAIFSRLEGRGVVAPLVASVGVGLIIQNGIRAVAGTQKWLYPVTLGQDIVIVPGLGIHPIRGILTLSVGVTLVLSSHVLLKYTNLGKAMRATADNLELAKATGIDTRRVTYASWAVSCSFASIAGVLLGLGSALSPTVGFESLLLIFAAVIVGGIGSPYGAMLGGLLVGMSQEMSVPVLVWLERPDVLGLQFGANYKVAVPFIILILVLIFRPWGIAGRKPAFAPRTFFLERITRSLRERHISSEAVAADREAGKS